jgi:hypothetical protein
MMGRDQFDLLRFFGIAPQHYLLDIGCGALSCGRFAIRYLQAGHYFGLEPERWLVDEGLRHEVDPAVRACKAPIFQHRRDFVLSEFGQKFDFLLAHSILTHASMSQISALFNEATRVMHDHSVFLASFREGPTDYEGTEWSYPEGIVYRLSTLESFAEGNGLNCAPLDWPHAGEQSWLVFYRTSTQEFVKRRLHVATLLHTSSWKSSRLAARY